MCAFDFSWSKIFRVYVITADNPNDIEVDNFKVISEILGACLQET